MAEFGGMDTGQVEPETRPEQAGGRSEPEPESGCANCGAVLGDSDGSTYCRRCEWWVERDERWVGL
jgi:hypothetical protein